MKKYLITFRSITPAQRAQRVLRSNGIQASIQRTPRWMEDRGCGYSLRMRYLDGERATQLLRQENLLFSRVFLEEDGSFSEVVT